MKSYRIPMIATGAVLLALGGIALAEQDRYTLAVPGGLSFAEFRGYDTWEDVAVSETETSVKAFGARNFRS